ncbi:MAG: S8 family serine peptidase [Luteolibacter sp.]
MIEPNVICWPDGSAILQALRQGSGAGVKVAILDSGVEIGHSAFEGHVLTDDLDFKATADETILPGAGNGEDTYGHGTAIAWLIWSMAPAARIGSFRIMGEGRLASKRHLVRAAAQEALRRGYQVLSCSFGHRAAALYSLDYKEWVDAAFVAGCSIVAACDNAGSQHQVFPAHFTSVIGVDCLSLPDAEFLVRRAGHLVEFAAPGENVLVPWKDGSWKTVTGSSYAAPQVTGLVARLLSMLPDLTAAQVKAALQAAATAARPSPWGGI